MLSEAKHLRSLSLDAQDKNNFRDPSPAKKRRAQNDRHLEIKPTSI
jgi:hypothetical protein